MIDFNIKVGHLNGSVYSPDSGLVLVSPTRSATVFPFRDL